MRSLAVMLTLLAVTACGTDYVPKEKKAVYDPEQNAIIYPHPCPDWSKTLNYSNSADSNFGCATETNAALMLEDPRDLQRGHGTAGPDTETTTRVIQRYRAGEIPQEFAPQEASSSGSE